MNLFKIVFLGLVALNGFVSIAVAQNSNDTDLKIPFDPKTYVCHTTLSPIIIDGIIDEQWKNAPWSEEFVDIEGNLKPNPVYPTRVKMLWDADYFYIAAKLSEPHIWAGITQHDAVIFQDNDFEVFIDPDGDTHNYYEFEINALNTFWDLLLTKPYRDKGSAINSWEIPGIKTAVKIYGSLNNSRDVDSAWTIEIAFPWKVLKECAPKIPTNGTQWRINFSRVEWQADVVAGKYVKRTDANGKKLPEQNWVWSPQGSIAMHKPETWGYVQFSTETNNVAFINHADEQIKWALRKVYLRQKMYESTFHTFTKKRGALKLSSIKINGKSFNPHITLYDDGFIASYPSLENKGKWYIQNDGRIWFKAEPVLQNPAR